MSPRQKVWLVLGLEFLAMMLLVHALIYLAWAAAIP